jgi:hypothetical protein
MAVGGWKSDRMVNHYTKTTKTEYLKELSNYWNKVYDRNRETILYELQHRNYRKVGKMFCSVLAVDTINKIKFTNLIRNVNNKLQKP